MNKQRKIISQLQITITSISGELAVCNCAWSRLLLQQGRSSQKNLSFAEGMPETAKLTSLLSPGNAEYLAFSKYDASSIIQNIE